MSVFMNVCLGTMCMQGLKRLEEGVRVPGAGVADGWLEDMSVLRTKPGYSTSVLNH